MLKEMINALKVNRHGERDIDGNKTNIDYLDDENLEMDFSGLINFTDDIIDFDFTTNIEKSNLFQLKFIDLYIAETKIFLT